MYSFGDFKHELDYILVNGYNCDIFSEHSLINGKLKFKNEVTDPKSLVKVKKNSLQKIVKYFGINNFENCCFLNSTLQVILNYPQFIILLKQYELRTRGQSKIIEQIVTYHSQIETTIVDLNVGKSEDCIIYFGSKLPSFNPCLDLVSMLGFSKNQHEDAEEFLTKFLTQIHEDLLTCEINSEITEMEENSSDKDEWVEIGKGGKNVSPPREDGGEMSSDTILSDLISGKMIEKVTKRNRISNSTVTPFFILPLNIQSENVTDVRTAIHSLTAAEKLSEMYERRMQIGHLPSLLILQLKRFTYTVDVGIQKIQKKIDINQILTIPQDSISSTIQQSGDVTYEIFAVVFHIGDGVMKGHYTTAIRDNNHSWYYLDDSNVFLVQGKQSIDWLLNSSSADIPSQLLLSVDLKTCAPRTACVSGRRSPYLIFYKKIQTEINK